MLNQTSFLKHIWGTVLHCSRVFDRPRGSVSLFFTVGSYHLMQIEVLPQIGQSVYNTRYLWVCKKPRLPKRFSKRPRVCNQKLKVVYIYIYIARDSDQRWKKFTDWNYIISRNSNTGLLPSTIPYRFSKHTLHKKHNWNKTWGNHKLLSPKTYNEQTHSPPGQNQSVFLTWLLPIINEGP